ncbi:apoptosis inhibitor 5-like [Clavelina lepadiformis]|uniref:apoptosis inhibitor 5-like n=1 Tax=Clavelina lepadiformis TaxID=159417 RepID=UPI00404138AC
MSVDVEQLYKSFGVLADAKDKAKEHPEVYKTILKGVEGTTAAKRLSAQFISRFFKHFSDQAEAAINALLDLCEDEDPGIRKAAIKEIPNLCKANKEHLGRLSDVLVQLLVSDDSSELSVVNIALNALFAIDSKGTLSGIFSQILNGDEEIREKALKFLCSRLKSSSESDMSKEAEEYVLEECKKILEDVTGDEFFSIMEGLSSLHHLQTFQGRQQLVNIIAEQMHLDQEFDATDADSVNRVSQCVSMAQPLCSKNVHASRFVNYMCQKVVSSLSKITTETLNGNSDDKETKQTDVKLDLLKQLAEMSAFCGTGSEVVESVEPLFNGLLECMPLPPEGNGEAANADANPKLQFSYVECLMFAFHQIGRFKEDFFTSDDAAARLKDFRIRLQYFARGLQVYIKQLKASLEGKTPTQLRSEPENRIKVIALKTCNNVNTLLRDLFHNPPAYKSSVQVSWKKQSTGNKPMPAKPQKRSSTGGDSEVKKKSERTLYRAPEGKYSSNISQRGQGGYKRGFRGGRKWGASRGKRY